MCMPIHMAIKCWVQDLEEVDIVFGSALTDK